MPTSPELPAADRYQLSPRLSLILCSRNDSWQGDPLWRLQTTLNFTAAEARAIGRLDELQIIVTDWGSTDPICESVALTEDAARVTRFINVPPELAQSKQQDSPFAEVIALNAAARRSSGDYIGRIDQDTLVGRRFLRWFFEALESGSAGFALAATAMISNRRRIPYDFAARRLPFAEVAGYVRTLRSWLPKMQPPPKALHWECYIGILLMHRRLWESAGGYDETFIYNGFMEFDFFLRLRLRYPGIDLGPLVGWDFHHLDHIPAWHSWATVSRAHNPIRTLQEPPPEFCPNGPDWGLRELDFPLVRTARFANEIESRLQLAGFQAAHLLVATATSTLTTARRFLAERSIWMARKLRQRLAGRGVQTAR
jgi:hypothetical protein